MTEQEYAALDRQRLILDEALLRHGYIRVRTTLGWCYTKPDASPSEAVAEIVRDLAGAPVDEEEIMTIAAENQRHHQRCERCGERLRHNTVVWLTLNSRTGLYHAHEADVPDSENQGGFPFGKTCAAAVLANGGRNEQIRRGKPWWRRLQ